METRQNDRISPLRLPPAGSSSQSLVDKEAHELPAELLSVLLHDLRSPLGAIGVLADLLTTVTRNGEVAEPRQIALLQEAVTKAQRVLDDAVEVQSIIRGSSTFSSGLIETGALVRSCIEKASHAPFFRNVRVEYESNGSDQIISTDVEKAETILLCALEHSISQADHLSVLRIYHSKQPAASTIHIVNELPSSHSGNGSPDRRILQRSLRGRLGSRRLGESRYSLAICGRVLAIMGGNMESSVGDSGSMISVRFPLTLQ